MLRWHRRDPRLVDARLLAPWGVFGRDLPSDVARERYERRLDEKGDEVVALLARLAVEHPGEQLVLCCFEDVHAGQECHRRWLAEWLEDRYDIEVPELTESAQLALDWQWPEHASPQDEP
jgi:hypothetical protein